MSVIRLPGRARRTPITVSLCLCIGVLCLLFVRLGSARETIAGVPMGFEHNRDTRYVLTGRHQVLETSKRCVRCHPQAPRVWRGAPTLCADGACHGKEDQHQGRFPACNDCHTPVAWKPLVGRGEKTQVPVPDRWRLGYVGRLWDPYHQNVLKGDYAIDGKNTFFVLTLSSDTLVEARSLPTPQGASPTAPGSSEFFGRGTSLAVNQNVIASLDLYHGSTAFRPKDWEVRATPVFNVNYLRAWETGVVNVDLRQGTTRTDYNFRSGTTVSLQEAFVGARLFRASRRFDFGSVRAGIQGFTSDFRGFIYADNQPGLKFFGNLGNNRYQWTAAYFYLLEKDTNSRLNTFAARNQHVGIANLYRQDTLWPGYTTQFSFHVSLDLAGSGDAGGQFYDANGGLVRPAAIGALRPHDVKSYYLGWTGEGHIGRVNVSHAFYQVLGTDTFNPLAKGPVSINAQMAALELSGDINWLRPKVFAFFASGDPNPLDDRATGFDSIVDNVDFAGGGFGFFNRQGIGLPDTRVSLVSRMSLVPNLRSDKNQGQANFVNPGLFLGGAGLDADLTPKLKGSININVLGFVTTEPLHLLLQQTRIGRYIGEDYALRLSYRPLLTNNIIATLIVSALRSGDGLTDLGISPLLYSAAGVLTLAY